MKNINLAEVFFMFYNHYFKASSKVILKQKSLKRMNIYPLFYYFLKSKNVLLIL